LTARPTASRTTALAVTASGGVIVACAFAFSFGNIWHLARLWGLPDVIAPLVAPMLDISVFGLLTAVRHLTVHGVPARQLLGARLLMFVCAVATWALNIAGSVIERRWGAAVMDSVAPMLMIGWAEVGPTLLRLAADMSPRTVPSGPAPRTPRPPRPPGPSEPPPPRRSPALPPPSGIPRLVALDGGAGKPGPGAARQ
jgi:hypothetical protein